MERSLLKHGNNFEKKYSSYSLSFPNYEIIWSNYIGCTSDFEMIAKELPIDGISLENDLLRKKIGQWNYTIFVNFIHLNEICDEISEYCLDNFTKLERVFLMSMSLFYNSNECFYKISKELVKDSIYNFGINDYLSIRNPITHTFKPIIKIVDNQYCVIDPNDYGKLSNQELDNKIWSESFNLSNEFKFITLPHFIELLKQSIIADFNEVLKLELLKFSELGIPKLHKPRQEGEYHDSNGIPYPSASIYTYR